MHGTNGESGVPSIARSLRREFDGLAASSRQSCSPDLRTAGIEMLARLAALLAGKDPDAHARIKLDKVVAFDDVVWRYPDFLIRAEAAYRVLEADRLPD